MGSKRISLGGIMKLVTHRQSNISEKGGGGGGACGSGLYANQTSSDMQRSCSQMFDIVAV